MSSANQGADVFYDCTHYALHHTKLPAYLREVKKYHLAHHYKNYELGFGVTSTSPTHTLTFFAETPFDHRQALGCHLQHRPPCLDTRSLALHYILLDPLIHDYFLYIVSEVKR